MAKVDMDKIFEMDIDIPKKIERREKDADDRKTYDEVFDKATLMVIYKLITDKIIKSIDCPISTGKEANIFKGTRYDGTFVAIKIYRLATATFKNIIRYIDGDQRFKNIRRDHRSLIYVWAKKEFKNLERMHENNLPVPKPICSRKNILVMEFIGLDGLPAPELRLVRIKQPGKKLKLIIQYIKTLYAEAGLVHADLSEYNILMNNDDLVIIDVGQSVLSSHPMANELLINDIKNICNYFKRVYNIKTDINGLTQKILKLGGND